MKCVTRDGDYPRLITVEVCFFDPALQTLDVTTSRSGYLPNFMNCTDSIILRSAKKKAERVSLLVRFMETSLLTANVYPVIRFCGFRAKFSRV